MMPTPHDAAAPAGGDRAGSPGRNGARDWQGGGVSEALLTPEHDDIEAVGASLRRSFDELLNVVPGVERRPSALAERLGVHRVIVSKLVNALRREDPLEVLQQMPGPESLRAVCEGALALGGVPSSTAARARACADRFEALIRERFGTRGALDAAISDENDALRRRYEESARSDAFNGMRHVLGVEGETWLTTMIFAPGAGDDALAVTTLHGVLGMRRLRPDSPVRFTFGPPYRAPGVEPDPLAQSVELADLYTNEPAPIETELNNGQLVHRLATGGVGKDALVDMLAVSHDPRGSRRYAAPDRALGGVALFHDVPVRVLHCDAIVHESVFPGPGPRLLAYNPGSRGPANPNDPSRDIDRHEVSERVESRRLDLDRITARGIPNYGAMLGRVFAEIGADPGAYRAHRVRIPYPVTGFQYVLAFEAPERPA